MKCPLCPESGENLFRHVWRHHIKPGRPQGARLCFCRKAHLLGPRCLLRHVNGIPNGMTWQNEINEADCELLAQHLLDHVLGVQE